MSKSNQRKIDCNHESGHAVMAWIEGVEITESRLVPEDEPGKHSATTTYGCPGVNPEDWTLDQIASRMRIALAGMEGENRGPLPVSTFEQAYAKRQGEQHCIQAMQYAKQFGGTRIPEAGIPTLAVSAEKDVIEVFRHACVVRCVEALARELLRRERIAGPDVEAFIASRITEEQRATIRRECCLTTAKKVQGDSPTT
jgi:hypothetical protein